MRQIGLQKHQVSYLLYITQKLFKISSVEGNKRAFQILKMLSLRADISARKGEYEQESCQ